MGWDRFPVNRFAVESSISVIQETGCSTPIHGYDSSNAWCAPCYTRDVIRSFRHKGLQKYFETGSKAGIQADQELRLRMRLAALETANCIEDMDLPGFRLHPLKGDRKGLWAIDVSRNWRIVFSFEGGNVFVVDYEDYH